MTDRVRYVTVMLDQEYRTDDVEAITNAIHMVKGVKTVTLGKPVDVNDYINRQAIGMELHEKLSTALRDVIFPPRS